MKKCALMFNSLPTVENLDFSESEAFVTNYYTCTIRVLLPCNSYLFGIIIFFVWGFKPYQAVFQLFIGDSSPIRVSWTVFNYF